MKRFLWLGFVLFFYVICSGCGETYRAIIYPNPPVFPNPQGAHSVVAINDNTNANGTVLPGTAMPIDVSGDSEMTGASVGLRPVHAAQQNANTVLVANQAVSGTAADSMTKLSFSGTSIYGASTISLPENSAPDFVAIAPLDTYAYVTLPGSSPPSVGVVNTSTNLMITTVSVGSNPYALAVTPDKSKLYVANQGDGTITAFTVTETTSSVNLTSRTINGSLRSAPLWLVARTDSQQVYVLETSGTLASIAITSTIGPDTLTESPISMPTATTMTYDPNLIRLYIPGEPQTPGGRQLEIVDVSQSTPQSLAALPIAPVLGSARAQGDVCSAFNPSVVTSAAVAALPDGSRAYVGSYAEFTVNVTISSATANSDGIHTTYTYSLPSGPPDLLPGMVITISGITSSSGPPPNDFNGTFTIISVGGGTFEVTNAPTDTYVSGGTGAAPNICPQVTVINAKSYAVESTFAVPGFPTYEPFCAQTRFRMMMAAAGDSTRAYMSSCDGGNVSFINTSTDTYFQNLAAPASERSPIPPSLQDPPQNPVFLIAGP
ncbi:MAG: hypothetical protein ABSD64_05830 [Terriglobales bacterium]|jgi:YVTN family beta-propeller protein